MRSKQELKEWFWDLYNSCYIVKLNNYPNRDLLCYDENFNRYCKLKNILNEEIVYPAKSVGKFLFELDWENGYFGVDYDTIWLVLNKELNHSYQQNKDLIEIWLSEYDNLKGLIPSSPTSPIDIIFGYQQVRM